MVTAVSLGDVRLTGFDAFGANLTSQILQANLAVTMHEDDEWMRFLILHDERFDNLMLGNAELPGRFRGAAVFNIIVDVLGERYGVLA